MSGSSQLDEPSAEARTGAGDQPTPVAHEELVIATLRARAEPWVPSSGQLQAEIGEAHGIHIEDNRFVPLLSRLMQEGIIRAVGEGYRACETRSMNWAGGGGHARPIQSSWNVLHGCFTATQRGEENGGARLPVVAGYARPRG